VLLAATRVESTRVAKEPIGDLSALEARPLPGEAVARALGKTLEEKAARKIL
jgi:hypothetical protein